MKKAPLSMDELASQQLVLVVADGWDLPSAKMFLFERDNLLSSWNLVKGPIACLLGKKGIAWGRGLHSLPSSSIRKKEGDERAPAGIFPIKMAFGSESQEKVGPLSIDYLQTHISLEYVDDPRSKHYNQCVDVRKTLKDWNSAEKMLREEDDLYTLGLIVAYNEDPVVAGEGSCIFIHTWRNQDGGSMGCTVLDSEHLKSLVLWLDKKRSPILAQGPMEALEKIGARLSLQKNIFY